MTTTILSKSAGLFAGVEHAEGSKRLLADYEAQALKKIQEAHYEFVTGVEGKQLAAEPSFIGGVALYPLSWGEANKNSSIFLTADQTRGLRDYLNTLDI